jgi:NADH-quinone oxidoreductase subunit H
MNKKIMLISVNIIMLILKLFVLFILLSFDNDFFKFLPIILSLILSIAFLTLLERKVLAAMQRRRGPNVVGIYGFLQAFADGIKLILKETIIPSSSNYIIFLLSPILIFSLSLYGWAVIPFIKGVVISDLELGLLILLAISSLSVYGVIMSGWSSNSKYALLGALRSSAQMISYEVSLGLLIMPVLALSSSLNLTAIVISQNELFNCWPFMCSFIMFFICILAETNRLPFDLPEAESELVSGYNVDILL